MNTFEFFNKFFGKHLVTQEGSLTDAAWRALSSNHRLAKGTQSRLASGWAIVRPGTSSVQLKLAAAGVHFDERTRYDAFLDELQSWDGESPRLFLMFDKAPLPIANLFMTVDPRAVRMCSPAGVETFNWLQAPEADGGLTHKLLWKRKTG
jgi:hypothetical protein